jgi:hypothetical protein
MNPAVSQSLDLDAGLADWVDAATAGGFPAPARADRWRVLRAGVVNLWEFDTTEYWFANGWAQLTGRNETGKSSLMALTTLIPWLADTSSSNIDTLGRSGKRFRYYVEPTGDDGDRRQQDASTNRGWLWVEYGRLDEAGPRFFTSLLFAEARSAAADVRLTWCTVEGSARVREVIDLAPQRMVAAPKDLQVPGLVVHPSATAYREHVAARLLGSNAERLESIGKMLKVTRTPKLGAQLEIGFVQKHLRSALPELSRAEVDALADGWDQLDQIRADLASTKEAAEVLERFRRSAWLPWARATIRQRADAAGVARTTFDNVTRRETEARAAVAQSQAVQEDRTLAAAAARRQAESARRAAEELQSSVRYLDAHGRVALLEQHRQRQTEIAVRMARVADDLRAAIGQEQAADREATTLADAHLARADDAEHRRDEFTELARTLVDLPDRELDVAWVDQALTERKRTIAAARQQAARSTTADGEATAAEEVSAGLRERAEGDAADATSAWAEAGAAREALGQAVLGWAASVTPAVPDGLVDVWLTGLPTNAEQAATSKLADSVRDDWFVPAHSARGVARDRAAQRLRLAEAEVARLDAEIGALMAQTTPFFPPPTGWNRRARPDASAAGAPVWALVDPIDGVRDEQLAGVEAALAAASLLDAWVTPDGVYLADRDGADLVVSPPPAVPGPNLGELLQVADCDPGLARTVAALLAGIGLDPTAAGSPGEEPGGLAVAVDGRWQSLGLRGRAAPGHDQPEWLGESARANRRRRRVEELTVELGTWRAETRVATAEVEQADVALRELAAMMERRPTDDLLRAGLLRAAERDARAERSAVAADKAEAHAGRLRAAADTIRAELARFCAEHRLPTWAEELEKLTESVFEAERRLAKLEFTLQLRAQAELAWAAARERLVLHRSGRAQWQQRHDRTARELAETEATVATLAATIDANDREILDELDRLHEAERHAAQSQGELEAELGRLGADLGRAEAQLQSAEREREAAREVRDAAWSAFRVLLDRGLATEIGLTSADPGFGAAERVRDQVAIARREVQPPRWPTDPAEQDAAVRKLGGELVKLAEDTRIRLEAGGRTLAIVHDEYGLPVVEVLADSTGTPFGPRAALARLSDIHEELAAAYSQRVQETLDELLGSTFLEHLRERLGVTSALIGRINNVLAKHPVVTTRTSLKIVLEPASGSDAAMLEAVSGPSLANPEVAGQVRDRLRERVEEAKRLADTQGDEDWRGRLAQQLDYRDWFQVQLKKRVGSEGRWVPLTTQGFAEMSGGARAVILMLPLVATLAALYEDLEGCPRPLWLDEAFDGLDSSNREMVMDLFGSFDLDVLLAGPARLVNVRSVPAAAIYQVVRAPAPLPGVDLTLELWAGGDLIEVDLPTTLPVPQPELDTLL